MFRSSSSFSRLLWRLVLAVAAIGFFGPPKQLGAQELETAQRAGTRCVMLGLFVRSDSAESDIISQVGEFADGRQGVVLRRYNLDEPGPHVERFEKIKQYFGIEDAPVPAVYGCNYLLLNLKSGRQLDDRLKSLLDVHVYVRAGCPKCAAAKEFVARIKPRYPAFTFTYHEIVGSPTARRQVDELGRRYGKRAVSVPVFHFCNQLVVGWNGESTRRQVDSKLDYWTTSCGSETSGRENPLWDRHALRLLPGLQDVAFSQAPGLASFLLWSQLSAGQEPAGSEATEGPTGELLPAPRPLADPADTPVPGGGSDELLPPGPGIDSLGPPPPVDVAPPVDGQERAPPVTEPADTIDLPLFGSLSQSRLGMPLFTLAVGLVDGFNPCAMWVLLFLLSVLVNLKSRAKILAVAGTFVFISGVAYFAFMAAWLSVVQYAAHLRAVQITLGVLAVAIGSIHVKDFFAFKKGLTLSIPESAKPGIYARVRRIVMAENLIGAVVGASVLAVLVNLIELLCTAGLPSIYTTILTMQGYPAWKEYSYLLLYILAYMFDDSLMVTIVVLTLGRHKLQETEGRWLKLVSGALVLALGVVMLLRPEWLI